MIPKRILFVCTGNSCRSVMAQGLLQHKLKAADLGVVQVESAGVYAIHGMPASRETQRVMLALGIDCSTHRSRMLTSEMIRGADLILAMEQFQVEEIKAREPAASGKTHLLKTHGLPEHSPEDPNIPDPIGKPLEVYEVCLSEIREAIERLVKILK